MLLCAIKMESVLIFMWLTFSRQHSFIHTDIGHASAGQACVVTVAWTSGKSPGASSRENVAMRNLWGPYNLSLHSIKWCSRVLYCIWNGWVIARVIWIIFSKYKWPWSKCVHWLRFSQILRVYVNLCFVSKIWIFSKKIFVLKVAYFILRTTGRNKSCFFYW